MEQKVQDFIQSKRIAILGVSRTGKKFGYSAFTELKQLGYQVFIVHPEAKEIAGEKCYPDLASLRGKIDGVLICLPPGQAAKAMREAAEMGVRKIWLQQGAQSTETLELARQLDIHPVVGKCVLMYASSSRSFFNPHRLHGSVMKLIGQY